MRERVEDIPDLVAALLSRIARGRADAMPAAVSEEALASLRFYHWPGNATELRAVLESALEKSGTGRIGAEHLELMPSPMDWCLV